jgi:DNA topoisomerase-2
MSKKNKSEPKKMAVEDIYKKKTHHEHILSTPDTYIGSAEADTKPMYVYDDETKKIIKKDITFVPGLYKIYDEILVNARDHSIRDKTCETIKVNINKETGSISVYNDGVGIPVELHKELQIYIPEMIFGHLLTSSNYEQKGKIVGGKNGYGAKCSRWNTPIPFWNGEIKLAKDVKVGDQLIGDDGKMRTIKKVITGKGQMYEVEQANAEKYCVNDEHILTLHMPDHKVIFWNSSEKSWSVLWWDNEKKEIKKKSAKAYDKEKIICPVCTIELSSNLGRHYSRVHKDKEVPKKERKSPTKEPEQTEEIKKARIELEEFCKNISDDNVFDISIKEYMKLNDTTKMRLAGVRGQCVQWEKQDVSLDPYVLGLWLGDGYSSGYTYACYGEKDPQIIKYLEKWGEKNDATITKTRDYTYSITSTDNKGKKGFAPLKKHLDKYNLIQNKHIPKEYLVNDRDTRLKVLAGIIDTDGHVSREGTRVSITQGLDHEQLINDIVFLARSLGFCCQLTKKNTSWTWKDEKRTGEAYNINISGEGVKDIPTLLPRKKCADPEVRNTGKSTGYITVKDAGIDEYVGIEIDGNQRFVINDFTVTHNCANIYSTEFILETYDANNRRLYYQRFTNNMYNIEKPIIKTLTEKEAKEKDPFTKITFTPDFVRFGIKGLTNDINSLFKKRVYDMSACTDKSVKVYLNDEFIKVETFKDYIKLYYDKLPSNMVYDEQPRWKVGVLYDTNSGFVQMSFVNGVCTYKGGNHVDNVIEQITRGLITYIKEKKKVTVKAQYIRDNLSIYVDSIIEDPAFSSQTKEYLTSKVVNFGSKWEISSEFIKHLADTGIVDEVVKFAQFKEMTGLNKTDGKKVNSLRGIEKLDDANWAGTRKSKYCKLILTEGDSAKSFALSGLELIGRDKYGVFPLRGKLLNVREAAAKQLLDNKEFINIKKILGLKQNKKYTDVSKLRYGGIIILTDSDVDGSHIKGLIINMIHTFWPSLLKIKGFIQSMATPIIKAFKKSDKKASPKIFYTLSDYKNWVHKELNDDSSKYAIKYYKGLGTSTEKEAKETFNEFEDRLIRYIWEQNQEDAVVVEESDEEASKKSSKSSKSKEKVKETKETKDEEGEEEEEDDDKDDDEFDENDILDLKSKSYDALTLAFSKERADDRKEWLFKYDADKILEFKEKDVGYSDFVNKDLIHFSNYDNERSIPNVCDGFKPSQRKILFACLLKKLEHDEIKVAQLGAFVAEQTEYHHGEMSLQMAIITMAQDFVGSNNINLLQPIGNFGYRRMAGKESASPRYIFTKLSEVTSKIFRKEDEAIMNYIIEEGRQIEPDHYAPILPTVLINGCIGIGTGFSTDIPMFNPRDIANNIMKMLDGDQPDFIHPWYRGFKGTVKKNGQERYTTTGIYEVINANTVRVTEIPIGMSIDKYKETLESYIEENADIKKEKDKKISKTPMYYLEKVIDNGGNNTVDFNIIFAKNYLQKFIKEGILEKQLKLTSSISLTNMYLHNSKGTITKYEFIEDIFTEFYNWRLTIYQKRKDHRVRYLENQMNLLKYKVKFIEQKLNGEIVIEKRKEQDILDELFKKGYPKLCNDCDAEEDKKTFRYITDMPLFSLTKEKIDKLNEEYKTKKKEYEDYKAITIQQLWKREIEEFNECYDKWINYMNEEERDTKKAKPKKGGDKKVKGLTL